MPDPIGHRKWLFLLVCGCLIAPVSLFIHDCMLETLKVPYPTTVGLPTAVKFLNVLVRLASIAVISRLSLPPQYGVSKAIAAGAVGLPGVLLGSTNPPHGVPRGEPVLLAATNYIRRIGGWR